MDALPWSPENCTTQKLTRPTLVSLATATVASNRRRAAPTASASLLYIGRTGSGPEDRITPVE